MIIPEAYHPLHPLGSSFCIRVNPPIENVSDLIYINIPKNASSWVKYYLRQMQASFHNYHQEFNKDQHLALVILRDPLERWISALAQLSETQYPTSQYQIDRIDWEKITTTIIRDSHFQPQCDFFANIPLDRVIWFRCDSTLEHNFSNFLKKYNVNLTLLKEEQDYDNIFHLAKKIPKKNVDGRLFPPRQLIVEKIKSILDQNPGYVKKLKDLYKNDYEFLNGVSYYESR